MMREGNKSLCAITCKSVERRASLRLPASGFNPIWSAAVVTEVSLPLKLQINLTALFWTDFSLLIWLLTCGSHAGLAYSSRGLHRAVYARRRTLRGALYRANLIKPRVLLALAAR